MTKKIIFPLFFLPILFLSSCGSREKPAEPGSVVVRDSTPAFDPVAMQKILEPRLKAFATAFTGGDSAGMVNMYAPDARILPPNGPVVSGRAAIGKLVSAYMKFGIREFKDSTTALYGHADNVIEEGLYFMGDGKGHSIDQGKYIEVWRKAEGEWKIYADIFNSNLPVAKGGK